MIFNPQPLKFCLGHISESERHKVVDFWMGHWLGSVGMLNHAVTYNLGSTKVCLCAIFETYFSYCKDICIAVTYYLIYFYLIVLFSLLYFN